MNTLPVLRKTPDSKSRLIKMVCPRQGYMGATLEFTHDNIEAK
jgi:hypothetical protein